jgi:hypothetical protein
MTRLLLAALSALCLAQTARVPAPPAQAGPAANAVAPAASGASVGAASSRASASSPARERKAHPPLRPVQVFDVKAGRVVRTIPNDEEFQAMAREWLRSVTGLSPKLQPGEDCGFVYRVPLAEPGTARIGGTEIAVRDLFLFHCVREHPLLLVFDSGNRPYLLRFEADLRPFLRKLAAPEAPPEDGRAGAVRES